MRKRKGRKGDKDDDGSRNRGRSRCPGRKPFGLFQFDFSSVAVAQTTIRRRGSPLLPLSPLSIYILTLILAIRQNEERTNGLRPDARIELWSIESRCLSSSLIIFLAFPLSCSSLPVSNRVGESNTLRYRCVECVGPPTLNGWT